jgi:hypothetical protein
MDLQEAINRLWDTLGENYQGTQDIITRILLVKILCLLEKLDIIS